MDKVMGLIKDLAWNAWGEMNYIVSFDVQKEVEEATRVQLGRVDVPGRAIYETLLDAAGKHG